MVARYNGRERTAEVGNPNLSGWREESTYVSIVGCRGLWDDIEIEVVFRDLPERWLVHFR